MTLTLVKLNGIPVLTVKPDGTNEDPPSEFMLFPAGEHTSEKGTFTFNAESAKSVLARAKEKGNDIPIDYEHFMLETGDKVPGDGPIPAAGWFNLEVREGALWAVNVHWNPRAQNYLKQKEYRFMSPAFRHTKEGVIRELVNCALVNLPAQHNQTPLVAAKDDQHTNAAQEPPAMKHLLAKLKLSENAPETEAIEVVTTLQTERAELFKALGVKDASEGLGAIAGLKTNKDELDKAKQKIVGMEAADLKRKVEKLVRQGIKEKKISPAMEEQFREMGHAKGGISFLKAHLEHAAPIVGVKQHKQNTENRSSGAGASDEVLKQVAAATGVTVEKLKAQMEKGDSAS